MIKLKGIGKSYPLGTQQLEVLRDIDCEIAQGEYVAILGPSGSGKSTLMNILGCLDNPTSGQYVLNGIDVSDFNAKELAAVRNQQLGFIFQSFNLLPHLSALHNVALPLVYRAVPYRQRCQQARHYLEQVGLGNRLDHKPTELSGGQCQRVAIARALVGNPEIILADEPTGNLDSQTGQEIIALFERLVEQGKTLIIVTHDLKLAERSQRIIRLLDGRIAA